MTTHTWPSTRDAIIAAFNGQTPRPEDEEAVIRVFAIAPTVVLNAARETASALNSGKIRYGWSVLPKRLEHATTPLSNIAVTDTSNRERKVRGAANWIRNAGVHVDRIAEIEDELFNPTTGMLKDHDTPAIRQELLQLWREQRPRGKRAEAEHEAYIAKIKQQRADLEAKKRPVPADPATTLAA